MRLIRKRVGTAALAILTLASAVSLPTTASAHGWHDRHNPRVHYRGPVYLYDAPGLRRVVIGRGSNRQVVYVPRNYRYSPRRGSVRYIDNRRDYYDGRYCRDADERRWRRKHRRDWDD